MVKQMHQKSAKVKPEKKWQELLKSVTTVELSSLQVKILIAVEE